MDGSVIIPTFNGGRVLPGQLDALSRQEWDGDWEVVVVDDRSTDGSPEVARTFVGRLPRLRVIELRDHRGSAAARNAGVAATSGELLLFLDDDDVVASGYVRAMSSALANADVVCSRLELDRLNAPDVAVSRGPSWQWDGPLFEFPLPHAAAASLGIRREAFDAVGGFDAEISTYHDADLCLRLQRAGFGPPVLVPDAILHYRLRDRPLSIFRQAWRYGRDHIEVRDRHGFGRGKTVSTVERWGSRISIVSADVKRGRLRTRKDRLQTVWKLGFRGGQAEQIARAYLRGRVARRARMHRAP
jgi:GT2 family glycosyltransferase